MVIQALLMPFFKLSLILNNYVLYLGLLLFLLLSLSPSLCLSLDLSFWLFDFWSSFLLCRVLPRDLVNSIGCVQDVQGRKKRTDIFYSLRILLREMWKNERIVVEPAIFIRKMNQLSVLKDSITNANIEDTFVYLLEW